MSHVGVIDRLLDIILTRARSMCVKVRASPTPGFATLRAQWRLTRFVQNKQRQLEKLQS
jgi:hypothetical protein